MGSPLLSLTGSEGSLADRQSAKDISLTDSQRGIPEQFLPDGGIATGSEGGLRILRDGEITGKAQCPGRHCPADSASARILPILTTGNLNFPLGSKPRLYDAITRDQRACAAQRLAVSESKQCCKHRREH
jgi:hypothetical protein